MSRDIEVAVYESVGLLSICQISSHTRNTMTEISKVYSECIVGVSVYVYVCSDEQFSAEVSLSKRLNAFQLGC